MATAVSVAICLRDRLFRDGIVMILKQNNYRVHASVGQYSELKNWKSRAGGKEIIILGDDAEGLDLAEISEIRERHPTSLIVVLLDTFKDDRRWEIERLGVCGVLLKSISSEVLLATLKLVLLGEHVFSVPIDLGKTQTATVLVDGSDVENGQVIVFPIHKGETTDRRRDGSAATGSPSSIAKMSRRSELSERELEILSCLVNGNSNKVIARMCQITEATVKVHLKSILRKTEVVNRTQAAVWAINNVPDRSALRSHACATSEHG